MIEADSICAADSARFCAGRQHEIGADQRGAQAGQHLGHTVRRQIDMHDHADARRHHLADVARRGDAVDILPGRRRRAEQGRVEGRLDVIGVAQERIAVRNGARIGVAGMTFAAAEAVDLDAAGGGAVGDVADRHLAVGEGRDVHRPGPEFSAGGRREDVVVVAEIDLDAVVRRQIDVLKMHEDEFGVAVRRRAGVERERPGIRRCRRQSGIGSDLGGRRYGLNGSDDVGHGVSSADIGTAARSRSAIDRGRARQNGDGGIRATRRYHLIVCREPEGHSGWPGRGKNAKKGPAQGRPRWRIRRGARSAHHDDLRADLHAAVEVDHVVVEQAEAARRHRLSDRLRLVRAVDAVERGAEIHRARTERIFRAALHEARQVGTAPEHLRGRRPVRPFLLGDDRGGAGPGEADAPDADAVAQRRAAVLHQIEPPLGGVDDDRARRVIARRADRRARDRVRVGTAAEQGPARLGLAAGIAAVLVVHLRLRRDRAGGEQAERDREAWR